MSALHAACQDGRVDAEIALVLASVGSSPAIERARELGLETETIPSGEDAGRLLADLLERHRIEVICLAGYLRLLPPEVLQAFPDRVINIHPALLPKFGGKGMYGRHVHEAVLAAGEVESGCTVHLVSDRYDEGAVVLQLRCTVEPGDTPETLAARVLELEHRAFPQALAIVLERIGGGRSFSEPRPQPEKGGSKESETTVANQKSENAPKQSHVEAPMQHPAFTSVAIPAMRLVCWVLFTLLGPFRAVGRNNIPRQGGLLILANHRADVDPIVVQLACPRPIYYMAKSELFTIPILGRIMRWFRAFPVKRGEPDRSSIKRAVAYAHAGQATCLFPEGQLSETGELQELKPGAALIVRMADVPVICCGVKNTERILPYGKLLPRPALRWVTCAWGEPRTFERHATTEEIIEWANGELLRLTR